MKRVLTTLILAAALVSCHKDVIETTDEPVDTSALANDDPEEVQGEEDLISGVTFDKTITISWTESGVSIEGDETGIVSADGTFVTADNGQSQDIVRYCLKGSSSNGRFKLYGVRKQAIVLQGLNLTNKTGAAINNQSKKRTFVVLEGDNFLSDGPSYTGTPETEDEKAAFFSEGQLVFSGGGTVSEQVITNGSTTTEYTGAAGIKADSTFVMTGGVLTVASSGQGGKGISGDQKAFFKGGSVKVTVTGSNLSSGTKGPGGPGGGGPGGGGPGGGPGGSTGNLKSAKGIKFDGDVTVSGGSIEVSASNHEAFETKGKLTVSGGTLYAFSSSDDAINSAGDMTLSGGYVCGWSTGNDGIDANGNLYVDDACVYAVTTKGSPEVAVDANTEGGKKLYVKSGTLIAVGGLESGASITGSAYSASSWSKNSWHTLYDSSSKAVISFKTPSSGNSLVVYSGGKSASLKSGTSVSSEGAIWGGNGSTDSSASGGSAVTLSSYSSNSRW